MTALMIVSVFVRRLKEGCTFEDFVKFVVPELQRRGLSPTEYKGATLRENLGLAQPQIGGWKLKADA